ncbi:hypothetical protein NB545_20040 [Vibrio campbellii]|uniref:hypothetical protein n=1 Tax=Vibrio campbellii TaxID=680 RepID=UPI00215D4074|nr:hypothetical protein [Vibrio campbellii]MCR9909729.1 hypothetical protein [Vibrio campbellii]
MTLCNAVVSQRISTFEACPKPRGWHFGAKIHSFVPVILNLREKEGASFANISHFLKVHYRFSISRQRLHAYYKRVAFIIDENYSSFREVSVIPLPNFSQALERIKGLRRRAYWQLRSPLHFCVQAIKNLHEIYGYSFRSIAAFLRDELGRSYSRQAIFAFIKRLPNTTHKSSWGSVGI